VRGSALALQGGFIHTGATGPMWLWAIAASFAATVFPLHVAAALPVGAPCVQDLECDSLRCDIGRCAAPNCQDGVENGYETGVGKSFPLIYTCLLPCVGADCGGECEGCITQSFCYTGHDCVSGLCKNSSRGRECMPPQCTDGIFNGYESDKDCGGNCEYACPDGYRCTYNFECLSNRCLGNDKLSNVRYCAAPRLYDTQAYSMYTSVVLGGVDLVGLSKQRLSLFHVRFALGQLLDLPMVNIASDSVTDVQGPPVYGEQGSNATWEARADGDTFNSIDFTVVAARYRFLLYVEPYEAELYRERAHFLGDAYVDFDLRGEALNRGVQGHATLHQAGDEDGLQDRVLASSSSNVTAGQPLPDGTGTRYFLTDLLAIQGMQCSQVVRVDPGEISATSTTTRLYIPHHLVIERPLNRSATEPIYDAVEFPVQPIVYVADRHNRRIREFRRQATIQARLDPTKYDASRPDQLGRYLQVFGDREVDLTYINGGRAYFRDISISDPVPEGIRVQFVFLSSDPNFASLRIQPIESHEFVVESLYRPPKVEPPRIPFPPALVVLFVVVTMGICVGVAYFGVKRFVRFRQERHLVPLRRSKAEQLDPEDIMTIKPNFHSGPPRSTKKRVEIVDSQAFDEPEVSSPQVHERPDSKAAPKPPKPRPAGLHPVKVVPIDQTLGALGTADQERAFELVEMHLGQPVKLSHLPEYMQRAHRHNALGVPTVVDDTEGQKPSRSSWISSLATVFRRGSTTSTDQVVSQLRSVRIGPDGLPEVPVIAGPRKVEPNETMRVRPARTPLEVARLAGRGARRAASEAAAAVGMTSAAARLFPKEQTQAYLEGLDPEEVLRQKMEQATGTEFDDESSDESEGAEAPAA
jgi:hypothetical protein